MLPVQEEKPARSWWGVRHGPQRKGRWSLLVSPSSPWQGCLLLLKMQDNENPPRTRLLDGPPELGHLHSPAARPPQRPEAPQLPLTTAVVATHGG